jgi:hypothetical protein
MRTARGLIRLDLVFRLLIGVGFAYMIVAGLAMPRTSFGTPGLYPIFVGSIGLVVWLGLHVQDALRTIRNHTQRGRIYDIAYEFGDMPPELVRRRTLQTFGMVGALMLGVWLLSFQLAVPIFLCIALRLLARAGWPLTLAWMVVLELLIVVVFGSIAHVAWPRSVLENALGVSFQTILGAPFRRVLPF